MLKTKKTRRTVGAILVVAGGLLMWSAPQSTFGALSITGLMLMAAGIILEIVGISLEHREASRRR
jgi:uncharacterized membrane protein HdeD (DUF308 family)